MPGPSFLGDREPGELLMLKVEDDLAFNSAYAEAWDQARYDFYPTNREWPMPERYWFMDVFYYAAMSETELAEIDRIIAEEGDEAAMAYMETLFFNGVEQTLPETYAQTKSDWTMWNRTSVVETGPAIGTGVAALILAEVAFIAGAAFATGTRRRLREIGLIGANGASTI